MLRLGDRKEYLRFRQGRRRTTIAIGGPVDRSPAFQRQTFDNSGRSASADAFQFRAMTWRPAGLRFPPGSPWLVMAAGLPSILNAGSRHRGLNNASGTFTAANWNPSETPTALSPEGRHPARWPAPLPAAVHRSRRAWRKRGIWHAGGIGVSGRLRRSGPGASLSRSPSAAAASRITVCARRREELPRQSLRARDAEVNHSAWLRHAARHQSGPSAIPM